MKYIISKSLKITILSILVLLLITSSLLFYKELSKEKGNDSSQIVKVKLLRK